MLGAHETPLNDPVDTDGLDRRVRVMEPRRGTALRELWEYRDLLYFLTWRDLKVRYTQSLIGVGWAVGQPLLMMLVFSVFLGMLAKVPPPSGLPYAVFVLAGLVPWTFFASAISSAGQSVVGNTTLVEKVYFPRLLIPIAALLSWLPDLAIAIVLLVITMAIYGIVPGWAVVLLPAFVLLAIVAATSGGVWLSALNVAYRDIKHIIPFVVQLGMFATPVVYPATLVPESVRTFYGLNPMVGVVEGFRWTLLGRSAPDLGMMLASLGMVLVILVTGLRYFRRVERYFADVI